MAEVLRCNQVTGLASIIPEESEREITEDTFTPSMPNSESSGFGSADVISPTDTPPESVDRDVDAESAASTETEPESFPDTDEEQIFEMSPDDDGAAEGEDFLETETREGNINCGGKHEQPGGSGNVATEDNEEGAIALLEENSGATANLRSEIQTEIATFPLNELKISAAPGYERKREFAFGAYGQNKELTSLGNDRIARGYEDEDAISSLRCEQHGIASSWRCEEHGVASSWRCEEHGIASSWRCEEHGVASSWRCEEHGIASSLRCEEHGIASSWRCEEHGVASSWRCEEHGVASSWRCEEHGVASSWRCEEHGVASSWRCEEHGVASSWRCEEHGVASSWRCEEHGIASSLRCEEHGIASSWRCAQHGAAASSRNKHHGTSTRGCEKHGATASRKYWKQGKGEFVGYEGKTGTASMQWKRQVATEFLQSKQLRTAALLREDKDAKAVYMNKKEKAKKRTVALTEYKERKVNKERNEEREDERGTNENATAVQEQLLKNEEENTEYYSLFNCPLPSENGRSFPCSEDKLRNEEADCPHVCDFDDQEPEPEKVIMHEGRDVLDLFANITNSSWLVTPTRLQKNNLNLFFANRSQYHRLNMYGAKDKPFLWMKCKNCRFRIPVY
ncbi:uncharacterized protein LOC110841322 isoform X6 [Zootermopsis nevadensis]|uniref:uncharacterized protein LOC110841322 isoform X6 n=1 Tax=Zootermopsis nevadensis TaxID=136037 RepID=UPI000B8ED405|nr:uncharacterized protein LOC110841322 isoform X6 [Zootermopsis nevadensis]